jgi:hypothetical protein
MRTLESGTRLGRGFAGVQLSVTEADNPEERGAERRRKPIHGWKILRGSSALVMPAQLYW